MRAFNDKLFGAGTPTTAEMTAAVGTNTPITVAQGGTGAATLAGGGLVVGNVAGVVEVVAAGATTEILVGGGAATKPVWTTATGTGAPVRAGTPVFTTGIAVGGATAGTGGVAFPSTAVAVADINTLDDYEEGTWTPVFAFGGASANQTYGAAIGAYTKVGNLVTVSAYLVLIAKGDSTGNATITGFPFASGNIGARRTAGVIGGIVAITFADVPNLVMWENSSTIEILETTNAGNTAALTNADFANNSGLKISVSYRV